MQGSALRTVFAGIGTMCLLCLLALDSEACLRLFRLRRQPLPYCPPPIVRVEVPLPAPVVAREWPMFGGTPARNLANLVETGLSTTWDVNPLAHKNIKWVADLGSRSSGTPVVAGGRIFIGTNNQRPRDPKYAKPGGDGRNPVDLGVLMCFRESDGAFLWQAVHEKSPGGQVVDWPYEGIRSVPAVEGNRLYYVSNRGELICADVETGKAIWTLDMIGKLGVFPHNRSMCSPLVVDDLVFVVTSNGVNEDHLNLPSPKAPSFIAVEKRTGKVVWQDNSPTVKYAPPPGATKEYFQYLANRGDIVMHGQWSSPAYGVAEGVPQVIFPGGDGWLYSFEPKTGKLLWRFDCNPKSAKFWPVKGERSEFMGVPVVYRNRVYIGVGQDPEHGAGVGHFWCIDMTRRGDVSSELRLENDDIVKNPNSALVWHYGGVIDDMKPKRKLRRNYYFGRTLSTCAIHEGLVYITDVHGILHCLDAESGKSQWEDDLDADIWGSPMYADGKVYLGAEDYIVRVYQHGRTRKLLEENDMDGKIRSAAIANNGVLYVATESRLCAIADKKP